MTGIEMCRSKASDSKVITSQGNAGTRKCLRPFFWTTALRVLPKSPAGDYLFGCLQYLRSHGRLPNVRKPKYFNDHLFRLRVCGELDEPLRKRVSDKCLAKNYISAIAGDEYVLETYRVLETEEDIDELELDKFPVVIKPTHMSGHVQFAQDETASLDRNEMKNWLKLDYYLIGRERNYKDLQRKLIVESFFSDDGQRPPKDYKVFCFFGKPRFIQVDADRFVRHSRNLYSTDWTRLPFGLRYAGHADDPRPACLAEMLAVARKLAAPFRFIRIDFYASEDQIKVGELTNVPESATGVFCPRVFDKRLASLFEDPNATIEELVRA